MDNNSSFAKDEGVKQFLRPFAPFLEDSDVTELIMNRPGEVITKTFKGDFFHDVPELTQQYMSALITSLATYNGIGVSSVMYLVLPDGSRGTVIMPPSVIDGGLSFLIRKHSVTIKSLEQLHAEGALSCVVDVSFNKPSDDAAKELMQLNGFKRLSPFEVDLLRLKNEGNYLEFLKACVLNKRNIVIAGKTGSGKTTFTRSLIELVPLHERIVTIEDVHELILNSHKNKTHLLYGYGKGRISADECLAACMRLSPDRIFLAELRGNEAWEYMNSLNTGHPGSITTTHANNAVQTFERITSLIKKSEIGRSIEKETIKDLLYSTIDVILFMEDRKVTEVFYDPIFSREKMG